MMSSSNNKTSSSTSSSSTGKMSQHQQQQLPGWLWPNSNILPQPYKLIWEAVKDDRGTRANSHSLQRELLVDTNKIFPLLLTSQLPMEILGYIWSLANQKYAGQLTEQELYIVLALVALAQASYPFNSLDVLYLIRVPPIPSLNTSLLLEPNKPIAPTTSVTTDNKLHPSLSEPSYLLSLNKQEKQQHSSNSSWPSPPDDQLSFANSQVRTFNRRHSVEQPKKPPTAISQQTLANDFTDDFTEFQSAPPITNVPNIAIIDSKQGLAIGSRLANHNLGVKKMYEKSGKRSANNQGKSFLDTGSNNNSVDYCLNDLFPKCTVKNSQSKTVILRDTAIRNSEPVKIRASPGQDREDFGSFIKAEDEKVYGSKSLRVSGLDQDLMNLQPPEDKYSALRALVEDAPSSVLEPEEKQKATSCSKPKLELEDVFNAPILSYGVASSPQVDDFGDFVSAQQQSHSNRCSPPAVESESANVDLLSDFDLAPFSEENYSFSKPDDPSLMQEISEAFDALGMNRPSRQISDDSFSLVFKTDKVTPKEDTVSVNSIDIGNTNLDDMPRSASVPSLDLKYFVPSSQEEDETENMHQMIYTEWKQYMESCVLLLQVAANIFTSITSSTILRQVLASSQGYNFLCDLAQVAAVCRRVNFSHKEMDINIMGFDDLLMDIDRIWAEMEPYYFNIPILTELPVWPSHQGEFVTCCLCLTVITSGKVSQKENYYHASCANLWLNCVNKNLPVLKYSVTHVNSSTNM